MIVLSGPPFAGVTNSLKPRMVPPREKYGGSSQKTSIEVLLMACTRKSVGALEGAAGHRAWYNVPAHAAYRYTCCHCSHRDWIWILSTDVGRAWGDSKKPHTNRYVVHFTKAKRTKSVITTESLPGPGGDGTCLTMAITISISYLVTYSVHSTEIVCLHKGKESRVGLKLNHPKLSKWYSHSSVQWRK